MLRQHVVLTVTSESITIWKGPVFPSESCKAHMTSYFRLGVRPVITSEYEKNELEFDSVKVTDEVLGLAINWEKVFTALCCWRDVVGTAAQ